MKKLTCCLILLLPLKSINSQTSTYFPFPDSNVVWIQTELYNMGGISNACQQHTDFNYYISGDTTVGSYTFHKVYANYYRWNCPPGSSYSIYGAYMCAFRQDITNKRVYQLPIGETTETLAYDFNLSVGDTLNTYLGGIDYTVQSIDSVLIDGHFRKRFWLNGNGVADDKALIEGIGSTSGVFVPISDNFVDTNSLSCVIVNNEVVWTSSPENSCSLTHVSENVISESEFLVYPNPANSQITIDFAGISKEAVVEIKNTFGETVYSEKLPISSKIIDISNYSNGVYFVHLQSNAGVISKKFLKQ